jgi:hypothetical protein
MRGKWKPCAKRLSFSGWPLNNGSGRRIASSRSSYEQVLLPVGLSTAGGKMFDFLFDDDWDE